MISEIVLASVPTGPRKRVRPSGITCSQLFPCPYRLYKIHIGDRWVELQPSDVLRMEDGWYQEEQTVQLLKRAGIIVKNRQQPISVGKSNIPGHIDGTIELLKKIRLWEHKAMGEDRFWLFKNRGLDAFPNYKAQIHSYMLGMELDEAIAYAKWKDSCDPFDIVVPLDKDFILPIIEWADKIRLENWVPEPVECEYCSRCGVDCFGQIIDLSRIKQVTAEEMVEKWRKGKQFQNVGKMLEDDARVYFIEQLGDKDVLIVGEELKVSRIMQHRFTLSKQLVIQEFGPEGLIKVGEHKDITVYQVREISK